MNSLKDFTPNFTRLGVADNTPSKQLETFAAPPGVTKVSFTCNELTSFCPVTHQPDFNAVLVEYQPTHLCVESKSLKLYFWSFRNETLFGEHLASTIAHDLFAALQPQWVRVELRQNIRGGMQMTAIAEVRP